MARIAAAVTLSGIFLCWTVGHAQSPQNTTTVQPEVSVAEIERTLRAIDVDRTSGSDGERAAAEYLDRMLAEYGIAQVLTQSWPGAAGRC